MKIDILPFSTFKDISITNHVEQLTGTQCIYPIQLQTALIKTFIDGADGTDSTDGAVCLDLRTNSNDMKCFCFKVNNVYLYPKYTFEDPNVREPIIIVSDDFFEKYFISNSNNQIIHMIYDIPLVKMIVLKRLSGDFPHDESLKYLLTNYFESCSIVNLSQKIMLNMYDGKAMEFIVDNITYKTEFKNDIRERIKSIELSIKFNTYLSEAYNLEKPNGLLECETETINYKWYHHVIDKNINTLGYLVNNDVEIDFCVTEEQHGEQHKEPHGEPHKEQQSELHGEPQSESHKEPRCESYKEPNEEPHEEQIEISKDELLRRRLNFFNKIK